LCQRTGRSRRSVGGRGFPSPSIEVISAPSVWVRRTAGGKPSGRFSIAFSVSAGLPRMPPCYAAFPSWCPIKDEDWVSI
jgi:hypothetical protein